MPFDVWCKITRPSCSRNETGKTGAGRAVGMGVLTMFCTGLATAAGKSGDVFWAWLRRCSKPVKTIESPAQHVSRETSQFIWTQAQRRPQNRPSLCPGDLNNWRPEADEDQWHNTTQEKPLSVLKESFIDRNYFQVFSPTPTESANLRKSHQKKYILR